VWKTPFVVHVLDDPITILLRNVALPNVMSPIVVSPIVVLMIAVNFVNVVSPIAVLTGLLPQFNSQMLFNL